jgi:hypothetical protein
MNSPISEQEFDQLLSKNGGQSTISNKSSGPISLDEFDKMISGAKQKPQSTSESILSYLRNIPNAARQEIQGVPQFVSHGELNNPAINEFVEKSLGGLGFEGPALAGIAKRGISTLGEKLSPIIGKITGKEATEKSGNIIEDLVGENKLSEYHDPIVKKIRNLFGKDIEEVQGKFNSIGDKAVERGIGEVDKDVLDTIRRLKLKNESALKERVKNFKENPSYKEAHELQSELGKVGSKKIKSIDTAEKELGRKFLNARTELRSDIIGNFEKHNAGDLAQEYKDATQEWKNRVKIYDKNKTIRDIVHKTGIEEVNPINIDKVLTEDSAATRYVLSKLSQEEKDLILANRLKAANENPKKMVEKFNQLRNSRYSKLITPEHENAFADLQKSVEFANKFGKTALKGAAKTGGGILALLGLDKAGKYTGIL